MSSALSAAESGLNGSQIALANIAQNLANSNTVGVFIMNHPLPVMAMFEVMSVCCKLPSAKSVWVAARSTAEPAASVIGLVPPLVAVGADAPCSCSM